MNVEGFIETRTNLDYDKKTTIFKQIDFIYVSHVSGVLRHYHHPRHYMIYQMTMQFLNARFAMKIH